MNSTLRPPRIAVLIPCYNEEVAIADTVAGFRKALPEATVYVYDNNSKDKTMERAREAGAVVREENLQGKGNVVRRMFSDIDADVYLMTDGDTTYDPGSAARKMIDLLIDKNLDMVCRQAHLTSDKGRPTGPATSSGTRMLTGVSGAACSARGSPIFCRAIARSRDGSRSRSRHCRRASRSRPSSRSTR